MTYNRFKTDEQNERDRKYILVGLMILMVFPFTLGMLWLGDFDWDFMGWKLWN